MKRRAPHKLVDPVPVVVLPVESVPSLLDSTRAASPLTAAEGARIIDTTEVPVEEVVKMVLEMVEEARGAKRD